MNKNMTRTSIDYGHGKINIDKANGIRYGVISIQSLADWIYDELEPIYPKPELDSEGNEIDSDFQEPIGHELKDKDYIAEDCFDNSCLFLVKSPYYTKCRLCSPCAPGAGDLNAPDSDNGLKAYCFGHEFFNENKAPYQVYSVLTNELINPKQ